jgi:signal transduction histidine kinase
MSFISTTLKNYKLGISNLTFEESIQKRIYIVASLIAFVSAIIGISINIFIGLPLIFNTTVVFIAVSYAFFYYFARYKNKYFKSAFLIVSQIGLMLTWYSGGGLSGPVLPLSIITIIVITAIADKKEQVYYLIFSLLTIIGLFFLEESEFSQYIVQYRSKFVHDLDITCVLILSIISIYLFSSYIKSSFEKAHATVSKQKEELEAVSKAKDKLYSIIGHDLRGPFNGLIELTRLMADKTTGLSKEELQALSAKLSNSAKNTYILLENLLGWSKMNQGLLKFSPQAIPLKAFASVYLEAMQDMADQKNIKTENAIPDDLLVRADEYMLQTILRNLIINAIKYTNNGGYVKIGAYREGDKAVIVVEDNGIGMNDKIREKLFNYSQTNHRLGTDKEPSSGLGLLLTKEFVEKHQGSIHVESEVGKGSRFSFTLPLVSD